MKQYILIVISVLSLKLFAQDLGLSNINIWKGEEGLNRGDILTVRCSGLGDYDLYTDIGYRFIFHRCTMALWCEIGIGKRL